MLFRLRTTPSLRSSAARAKWALPYPGNKLQACEYDCAVRRDPLAPPARDQGRTSLSEIAMLVPECAGMRPRFVPLSQRGQSCDRRKPAARSWGRSRSADRNDSTAD